ncbi:MAG TPA: helix-turn-helix domain-containing protein, partial [Spirochaetia bacterium]|nr:helix-turn-helix domain-containing protein [Spirochaetia bacterium]
WIAKQHRGGAEIASLCVGAFLLAATGLMKGRQCATHWLSANEFRRRFPDVKLVAESIITDDAGIYTSGGAHSFWNLLLYLVEKYTDREIAIYASKFYEIEIDRYNQSPFLIFSGQKDHKDETVRKAQEMIETGYREKITVDQLSSALAVGRRSLERRFKQTTGNTVSEYMQRVRVEAAKKGLETGRKNVNEVMYEAGYSDTKAFREVFRKVAGMPPLDYRLRYNRSAISA